MRIKPIHLTRRGAFPLAIEDDASLCVVRAENGGGMLEVTGTASVLRVPLQGSVQVSAGGLARPVAVGAVLATGCDARTAMKGSAGGRWIALIGGRRAWALLLPQVATSAGELLPELHGADHETRSLALAVLRAMPAPGLESAVQALADKFATMQITLHGAMTRCPGRTWVKKRQVFLRLQHVRNYIDACCDRELDLGALARMANYSPWHFLRTFRVVYRTTPHAYVINQRLQRARRLLRTGNLAVTEVAVASGFENRSAFSRLYHQRFGTTAQDTKRRRDSPAIDIEDMIA